MKLLKLEIQNLASLDRPDGEVIDFESGALGESTIFSIVGPTGSGKSTILDAICLALYNRAPRYPKEKGGRNQKIEIYGDMEETEKNRLAPTDGRNILTKGKKEGYSKVTFLANNGNIYRAEWYVKFMRTNYQNAITSLYKLTPDGDRCIESEEDWNQLQQIIGLDYDQFLRTVLIAQGAFADFLNASVEDRYELLEKLVGCKETYTAIAKEINARKEKAQQAYNELAATTKAYKEKMLETQEAEALLQEIQQLQASEKKFSENLEQIRTSTKWYQDEELMLKDIQGKEAVYDAAKKNLTSIEDKVRKLELYDAILPAITIRHDWLRMEGENTRIQNAITETRKTMDLQNKDYITKGEELNILQKQLSEILNMTAALTPHIRKARELKGLLVPAREKLNEKTIAKETAFTAKNVAEKAVEDNAVNIQKADEEQKSATRKLTEYTQKIAEKRILLNQTEKKAAEDLAKENQKAEGLNFELLQQQKETATRNLTDLNTAMETVRSRDAKQKELLEKQQEAAVLKERNHQLQELISKLNIKNLNTEVEELKTLYTLTSSEQWGQHRNLLKEGGPCPLCGGLHHPYADNPKLFDKVSSELMSLLQKKKSELEAQRKQEQTSTGELQENLGKAAGLEHLISNLNADIKNYNDIMERIHGKHPEWPEEYTQIEALKPSCEDAETAAQKALTDYTALMENIKKLTEIRNAATKALTEFETNASKALEQAQQAVAATNEKLTHYKTLSSSLAQQLHEKQSYYTQSELEYTAAKDAVENLNKQYQEELQGKDPDTEEFRLTEEKQKVDAAISKQSEILETLRNDRSNLAGFLTSQEKIQQDNNAAIQEKKLLLEGWIKQYNESHDGTNISADTVIELMESTEDWNAIRQLRDERSSSLTSALTLLNAAKETVQTHQLSKPGFSREELLVQQNLLQEQLQQNHDSLIVRNTRYQNHLEASKVIGEQAEQLAQAEQENDDLSAITTAIGSDGKTLRKIAQCYTLQFLIEHANAEIRKFNSRYELMPVKNSLGIRVIDHDRADDIRDTTSLSGGETFIVSLGLALGLSSLSSRNISFGNLFIDEGFGTLDPEMLGIVIDALAMLQSSQNKKVGVISHTDIMSERITTQIRIIKNGNSGSSHIEVYPS